MLCPKCSSSSDFTYITTINGTKLCGYCGEKLPKPTSPKPTSLASDERVAALERRIAELETARTLDTIAAKMKTDRTAAWMGLPRIEERLKALEDKASYYHHLPTGNDSWARLVERVNALERRKR